MPDPDRSTHSAGLARPSPKTPIRYLWAAMLGAAAGIAVGGYLFWSHGRAEHEAETTTEPGLDRPAPQECAAARAALTAMHASGDDVRWRESFGPLTLKTRSQTVNPVDVPGYSDDEADNLRAKAPADWRGCAGLGDFVRGLGLAPMSGDEDTAEVALGRPGFSAAGDEAKMYEVVRAPRQDDGAMMLVRGPWLVTLRRDGATWRTTAISDLSHRGH